MVAALLVFYKLNNTFFTQRLNGYLYTLQFLSSSVYLKLCTTIKMSIKEARGIHISLKTVKLSDLWAFMRIPNIEN